ncbi:Transposable element Tc3 transposase, partial [Stegodyphus mimosarum]
MHDHTELTCLMTLESKDIHQIDWPAKSPDLKPIEHAWDALGKTTAICQPLLRTIQELKTALVEEWVQLTQALLNSLVKSMSTRACCLSVTGNQTLY